MPQSCVRFLRYAYKLYLNTRRYIPKHLHGNRAITPKMADFFSRPSTFQPVHFPGKGGVFYGRVSYFGGGCTTLRTLRIRCQSWSLNSLLLVPFVGESAGEILSSAVYRKCWIFFHYVWASQPDCSPPFEWRAQTYHIASSGLLVLPNTRTFIAASKAPWARWPPDEHKMQGEATPVRCK